MFIIKSFAFKPHKKKPELWSISPHTIRQTEIVERLQAKSVLCSRAIELPVESTMTFWNSHTYTKYISTKIIFIRSNPLPIKIQRLEMILCLQTWQHYDVLDAAHVDASLDSEVTWINPNINNLRLSPAFFFTFFSPCCTKWVAHIPEFTKLRILSVSNNCLWTKSLQQSIASKRSV